MDTKKRGTLLLLILFPEALVNPLNENKQATPTPNMNSHQTEQSTAGRSAGGIYISQRGVYCLLVLGLVRNLPDFRKPKQAPRTPHCLKFRGPHSKRF